MGNILCPKIAKAIVLLLSLSLPVASLAHDDIDEMHMGINEGTRFFAVTAVTSNQPVWRLWPEEVAVTHTKGHIDYFLDYRNSSSLTSLLRTASYDKTLAPFCHSELSVLLKGPEKEDLTRSETTTIYIPTDAELRDRVVFRAGGGLRIRDVGQLRSIAPAAKTRTLDLNPDTRAVFVRLNYMASYYMEFTTSDISARIDPASGELRIRPLKTGLALLEHYASTGQISPKCWDEVSAHHGGPPLDTGRKDWRQAKTATALVFLPASSPRRIQVVATDGLTFEDIEELQ